MIVINNVNQLSTYLIKDSVADYKIVIPENAAEYEKKAASELAYFLEKATGAKLETVSDKDIAFTKESKYLFLGEVNVSAEFKNSAEYKALNAEGFAIETVDNSIFISGKTPRGTLFGVYKFLEKTVGYRYYSMGQINFTKKDCVPFMQFDWMEQPDIEYRSLGFYETFKIEHNPEFPIHTDRLRLARTLYTDWMLVAHTYFQIMPKSKYFESHRDWYSPDGGNLCLSNQEMRKEFLENLKEIISNSSDEFAMIGQEDTFEYCTCPACTKRVKEDGGNPTWLMMEFSNEIATKVQEWLKETNPNRKLKLCTFAYNAMAYPPVKYNEATNKYEPLKESYKAVDNLAVMVVPRRPAHSKNYFDEKYNKHIKGQLKGWQVIAKELHCWTYCVNYDHFLVNFNNIYALQENYEIFKNIGVTFMFDQGATNVSNPTFDFLRQFLQSELLWDTTQATDKLIDEFMNAYYMEVAPYMRKYFDKVFQRWKEIESLYGIQSYTGGGDTYYLRKEFWPKEFIDECMDLFRTMRGEIEKFATFEDWDKYVMLRNRILRESLAVRFLLLNLYGNYFGEYLAVKIKKFLADCKKCGVQPKNEGLGDIEIV